MTLLNSLLAKVFTLVFFYSLKGEYDIIFCNRRNFSLVKKSIDVASLKKKHTLRYKSGTWFIVKKKYDTTKKRNLCNFENLDKSERLSQSNQINS